MSLSVSAVAAFAVLFFTFHLPYLPTSLEDVDSINFALGMRQFDVARHQPHPPGYPLFILAAKAMRTVVPAEPRALAAISVLSAALGIAAMFVLFRRLADPQTALIASLMAGTAPLYWFTAARPLSDSLGLTAAVAVQALVLGAHSATAFAIAAFLAGLSAGIRSQVTWLTVPLFVYAWSRSTWPVKQSTRALAAFAGGVAVWLVPLVVLTGGPAAYWHAVFDQGAEDLSGIRMLWTSPTPRTLVEALYYAFVAPWAVWPFAAAILALAVAGTLVWWRSRRFALAAIAAAFVPYFVFDLLFQETFTVRYALPLVVPLALLAGVAVRAMPPPLTVLAALPLAMYGAHVGGRSIAEYSRHPAPVFRMLDDMRRADVAAGPPVLAPDRRLSFDLRRPMAWLGQGAPRLATTLPSPPQHEWLEAAKYWDAGGQSPVWFAVDPRRAAIDLVQHGAPASYRWSVPFDVLLSGTRPSEVDWYRVDHPEWYVGEGWALTPEAAGVADVDRRGLQAGPIHGRIRRDVLADAGLVLGGRNFDTRSRPELTVRIGDRVVISGPVAAGPFLYMIRLPPGLSGAGQPYEPVDVFSAPPANVAIEQFDVSAARGVVGYGPGWYEREFNPVTGRQWRWLSDRAELHYLANGATTLRISGESPLKYYRAPSRLTVRAGGRVLADATVSDDFSLDVALPEATAPAVLTLDTDQTHVPAESGWRRTADRRRLGLRIYACELRAATASGPGTGASSRPAH